jgi:hypothetical protein
MWNIFKSFKDVVAKLFPVKRLIYAHPSIPGRMIEGERRLATFSLGEGQWIVIAKAAVKGYGGNDRQVDCRLKLVGTETIQGQPRVVQDESYESPSPLLGSTVMVMLPIEIEKAAEFDLMAGTQFGGAEFLHVRVCAIRDATTI